MRSFEIPFDFSNKRGEEATRIFFLEMTIKNICKIDHGTRKLTIDVYDIYEERNRSSFIERGDKKNRSQTLRSRTVERFLRLARLF